MAATGIGALGLDWKAFLFQALNFLALLALLRVFAYPAMIRALEGRKRRIDEQLKNAAELERKLAEANLQASTILDISHAQAQRMLQDATRRSEQLLADTFEKSQQEAEQLVRAAHARIAADAEQVRQTLKSEAATLVVAATERVLGEKMTGEKDMHIIERALS
jgi:F-type H+-transporting ATPase subunit b